MPACSTRAAESCTRAVTPSGSGDFSPAFRLASGIPQMGHLPGSPCTTDGCMGQ